MTVRYEDVCCDPVHKIQGLFSFSRLTWNEQTSNFIKASTLGVRPGTFDRLTQDSQRTTAFFEIQSARQISGGVR